MSLWSKDKTSLASEVGFLRQEIATLREELAQVSSMARDIKQLVGPFGLAMPDGTVLTQSVYGIKYLIDASDDVMAPEMIVYRNWEAEVSAQLLRLLTPDTLFVDVGANFGYFTCLAAGMMGNRGKGQVIALEPNPRLVPLLRRNVDINWSAAPVTVIEAAAAENAGSLPLFVPRGRGANGTLSQVSPEHADSVEVRTVRLDDVLPPEIPVDILKIDVEGHEYTVLKGAQALIERSPNLKMIIEWSAWQMHSAGVEPVVLADFLAGLGFKPTASMPSEGDDATEMEWDSVLQLDYMNLFLSR